MLHTRQPCLHLTEREKCYRLATAQPFVTLKFTCCAFMAAICHNQAMFCIQTPSFSPLVSASPPPFAPLARAESSSSISSITSHSAASTPTLGRDLNLSNTGTLWLHVHPSCSSLCRWITSPCLSPLVFPPVSTRLETRQPLIWFDHGRFYLALEGESSQTVSVCMQSAPCDTLPPSNEIEPYYLVKMAVRFCPRFSLK